MRIAIVHDDFMQYGGAEKLAAAILETFPEADLYTSIYDPKILKLLKIPTRKVTASFMQKIPVKRLWYRGLFFLYPLAFEWLSSLGQMDKYRVVISSTARFAHGVLTKPSTTHIAYVNSPGRAWWEPEKYFSHAWQRKISQPFLKWLRFWDKAAVSRVDILVANSKNVASKVEFCYGRKADAILYPFFETSQFPKLPRLLTKKEYFLIVTRLVAWKRVDIAVKAFSKNHALGNLVVVGTGPARKKLVKLAEGASNISFVGRLTNKQLAGYYKMARALIVTQEEDFGITPLEAMAYGTPVVAYKKGGVLETAGGRQHGIFYNEQSASSLSGALTGFSKRSFKEQELKRQADKFTKERFQKKLEALVKKYV